MTAMTDKGFILTGRHVVAMLLGFFAIILAVNIVFVYLALDTFRGVTTEDAYVKGLNYNETLERSRSQAASGWQVDLTATPGPAGAVTIDVAVNDMAAAPIALLAIEGSLRHPADEHLDVPLSFAAVEAGLYRAEIGAPTRGQWDAVIVLTGEDGATYRLEKRLWLK